MKNCRERASELTAGEAFSRIDPRSRRISRNSQLRHERRLVLALLKCVFGREVIADVMPERQFDQFVLHVFGRRLIERLFNFTHD